MSSQESPKQPLVTRNFLTRLARGTIKLVPLGGGVLDEIIFGTLTDEASQRDKAKLNDTLEAIRTSQTEQDTDLGDVLRQLEQQAEVTAETRALVASLAKAFADLKAGDDVADVADALPATLQTTVTRVAVRDGVEALRALSPGDLLTRIKEGLSRQEVASVWYKTFGSVMDDDQPGKQTSDCIIEMLDRARRRRISDELFAKLVRDYPYLAESTDPR